MSRIRVGIIGASAHGSWGARAHIPALRSLPQFELAGVATTRLETARLSADAFGIPQAFGSVAELAESPDIDLVAVCVRVPHHAQILEAVLKTGKQVYCEWPLTVTTSEAERALALTHQYKVTTAIGLQARVDPAICQARRMLSQGVIGQPQSVSLTYSSAWPIAVPAAHALMQDASSGLSQLELSGGHCLDALCWLLGEFTELSATMATHVREAKIIGSGEQVTRSSADQIVVQGTLVSGVTLSAHIQGAPGAGTGTRIEVQGTSGCLLLSSSSRRVLASAELTLAQFAKGQMVPVEIPADCIAAPHAPSGEAFNVANMYARFAEALQAGKAFEHDFAVAVRRHRMLDAIRRSAATGQRVAVN